MNGIGQLFRALVMETVALTLLFWLAFYQLMPQTPGDSVPNPLVIRSAPERFQLATNTVRSTQERIESAARHCYETAFRAGRTRTESTDEEEAGAVESRRENALAIRGAWKARRPNSAASPASTSSRTQTAPPLSFLAGAARPGRAPFKTPFNLRR